LDDGEGAVGGAVDAADVLWPCAGCAGVVAAGSSADQQAQHPASVHHTFLL